MRARWTRIVGVLLIFSTFCAAVAFGRTSTIQHWLARTDGFVVTVANAQQVLSAKSGEIIPVEYEVTNVTSDPVEILGIQTGCGCASARPIPCQIPAHSKQKITLTISLKGRMPGDTFEMHPELYVDKPNRKTPLLIRIGVTN